MPCINILEEPAASIAKVDEMLVIFPPDDIQEHSNIHSYYYGSLKSHILKTISMQTIRLIA
jgi:hypothetical protein